MKVTYALERIEKSIFLAGPTPRDETVPTWRKDALVLLNNMGFTGTVYVPESDNWRAHGSYNNQVDWEWEALNVATVIAFWIPRDLSDMPAFTTNVEFGLFSMSSKAVLGYPLESPKMNYLKRLAQRYMIRQYHSLEETLKYAVWKTEHPFEHNRYKLDDLLEENYGEDSGC